MTSIGDEHERLNRQGALEKPIGSLILKFHNNKLTIGNCEVDYDCIDDQGKYEVIYRECGQDADYFTLVIPSSGNPYLLSSAYDTSSIDKPTNTDPNTIGIKTLDAIASRKEVMGNTMEISN